MRIFTLVAGTLCLFAVLLDTFQTIILPAERAAETIANLVDDHHDF
jgi:hypothetical protein